MIEILSGALDDHTLVLLTLAVAMLIVSVSTCLFFSNDGDVGRLHEEIRDLRGDVHRLSREVVSLRKYAHRHEETE